MREDVVVYLGFDLERSKNTSRSSKSRNLAEEWGEFRELEREREEESLCVLGGWSVRE